MIRFLVSDPAFVHSRPCFSPAGDRVLFMRAPATDNPAAVRQADLSPWTLWAVPVEGGEPAPFFGDPELPATRPDWSPVSRRVAFTGMRGANAGLWILDEDGQNPRHVPVGSPPAARVFYPSWFPDGRRVAVTDYGRRQVLAVDVETGETVPLTHPERVWAGMCAVSPAAGTTIAFAGQLPGSRYDSNRNRIWVQRAGGDPVLVNPGPGRMPAWSPDGRRVAFTSTRLRWPSTLAGFGDWFSSGRGTVYVQEVGVDLRAVGRARAATPEGRGAAHARWSPDGKFLVCMLGGEPGGIALVDLQSAPVVTS